MREIYIFDMLSQHQAEKNKKANNKVQQSKVRLLKSKAKDHLLKATRENWSIMCQNQ